MVRPQDEEPDEHWRMTVNLLAIIAVLVMVGVGFWLLRELNAAVSELRALLDELGEDPDLALDDILPGDAESDSGAAA